MATFLARHEGARLFLAQSSSSNSTERFSGILLCTLCDTKQNLRFTGPHSEERNVNMLSKKNIVAVTLATGAAALLGITQGAWSGTNRQANKLEGAWIAKSTTSPVQASYVLTPSDPSGQRATLSGLIQVGIPIGVLFPEFADREIGGDFVGEAVMTGPNTASYTIVGYGRKKLNPPTPFEEQVVLIWVDSGQIRFTGPDKVQVTHYVSYYHPAADADKDGLPDPGKAPVVCLPATTLDTRVGLIPPCTP